MSSRVAQYCEQLGYDFVLRVAQDRVIKIPPEEAPEDLDEAYLKTLARALPSQAAHFLTIPAHHHHPKRDAFLHMSFQKVRVQPPLHGVYLQQTELTAWVVRVWETHPPEGQEPLEWILLTTLPMRGRWSNGMACAGPWKISIRDSRRAVTWRSIFCKASRPSGNYLPS